MSKYKLSRVTTSLDDDVHYAPIRGEFDPFETYCGYCDSVGDTYAPTTRKVTCRTCKLTAEVFKDGVVL